MRRERAGRTCARPPHLDCCPATPVRGRGLRVPSAFSLLASTSRGGSPCNATPQISRAPLAQVSTLPWAAGCSSPPVATSLLPIPCCASSCELRTAFPVFLQFVSSVSCVFFGLQSLPMAAALFRIA
ncbi:hypothetical protein NDU88_002979 [Pleurodeles waltl]|uniref:Uncharacterized protein n=1 Tax=Pleurodeles waltl TaxID=8319 RepID=A0AAV7VE67_PLEWA|nr:hypothetical protein NDU88_002979 [Pleurodeles waltl]